MTTENNVVSMEHSVNAAIERKILENMQNRGAKWVSEPFIVSLALDVANANVRIKPVIDEMVKEGVLEKSFQQGKDHFDRVIHLPLYRLSPQPW